MVGFRLTGFLSQILSLGVGVLVWVVSTAQRAAGAQP